MIGGGLTSMNPTDPKKKSATVQGNCIDVNGVRSSSLYNRWLGATVLISFTINGCPGGWTATIISDKVMANSQDIL